MYIDYYNKVLITFNYKEGTQTITFEEAAEAASEGNGSDLDCFTAPENAVKSKDFMAFLFFWQGLHTFAHLLHTLQKSHVIFEVPPPPHPPKKLDKNKN